MSPSLQLVLALAALAACALSRSASAQITTPILAPICDSEIYCTGELLHTVQMARINEDSKTFVDMKLKSSPLTTLNNFRTWKLANPTPSRAAVRQFVDANFDAEGSEFQPWTPSDHTENPGFLADIKDPEYRRFARHLNQVWLQLGRNMTEDVALNPSHYSIMHVPNPVMVPGGRFREFYYWDSYWVILGLLHSEMATTVRGMLGNFLHIVERNGFIPNAGRIYYLGRSQPPLLIPMIKEYVDVTQDWEFVRANIAIMEREFAFWFNEQKAVQVKGHWLSRYTDRSPGPRPESYWEDRDHGRRFLNDTAENEYYAEMKAAAESGMDFSTRWFIKDGTNNGTLVDLKCRSIVPVELNAILYWNAQLLAEFYEKLGNAAKATEYRERATQLYAAIEAVFWHEDVGAWLDWDLLNGKRRDYFVPTNLSPLWVGAFNRSDSARLADKVLGYVKRLGLDTYAAGVPNSMVASGEQWDYPNVWPPMQHMLIVSLANLKTKAAEDMAFKWAGKWVYTNFVGFNSTSHMYEKYSANEVGVGGKGGEYEVQLGFGWSNGVVLDLLKKYGDRLQAKSSAASLVSSGVLASICIGLLGR